MIRVIRIMLVVMTIIMMVMIAMMVAMMLTMIFGYLPLEGSCLLTCLHLDSMPWVCTLLLFSLMNCLLWLTVVSSLSQLKSRLSRP